MDKVQYPQVAFPGLEILRCEVGSGLHGLALEGADDLDLMSVVIEDPEYVCGLKQFETKVWRTQPEGARSGPGDIDLVAHSLRKFCNLALKGNPTILTILYAPVDKFSVYTEFGAALRPLTSAFLSKNAGNAFIGYLRSQRLNVEGSKAGHRGKREGRTAKWASHILRLGFQGLEYLETGWITLPMPREQREICLDAKRGNMTVPQAIEAAADLERQLVKARDRSSLPDKPDYDRVNRFLIDAHKEVWERYYQDDLGDNMSDVYSVSDEDTIIRIMEGRPDVFQTVGGLVRKTRIDQEIIEEVLKNSSSIRQSKIPTLIGSELYLLASQPVTWREKWMIWRALITKQPY